MVQCFSIVSVLILTVLAASMLVLPLILPPLPPPPLMILFFPVGIMAALMFLALSPSDAGANVPLVLSGFMVHSFVSSTFSAFEFWVSFRILQN
ncbi:hypothetical protein DKX38_000204 [Salix brachista]|uniref:Uncharacterized protein n=1 Tax=Salix brachista TaxID=2182728 RepID=A0A5N5NZZ2_9ROSI|nr:hypothetical protein DKX38_000204 [Salix brachista]